MSQLIRAIGIEGVDKNAHPMGGVKARVSSSKIGGDLIFATTNFQMRVENIMRLSEF